MNYQDAAVQDLIRALKYDGSGAAVALAAAALADYLREQLVEENNSRLTKYCSCRFPCIARASATADSIR